jgi:hypothetical protein
MEEGGVVPIGREGGVGTDVIGEGVIGMAVLGEAPIGTAVEEELDVALLGVGVPVGSVAAAARRAPRRVLHGGGAWVCGKGWNGWEVGERREGVRENGCDE